MMTAEYIKSVASEICSQLLNLAPTNMLMSWGIEGNYIATQFKNMPSLAFKVSARLHEGLVIVALDEGEDLYEIHLLKHKGKEVTDTKVAEGIFFEDMPMVIDRAIEVGNDPAEYQAFCEGERAKLMAGIFI